MFKLLRWALWAGIAIVAGIIVLYFLPSRTKEWVLAKATGVVPEALRERAEDLILAPPEQRSRAIRELEAAISALKRSPGEAETDRLIAESESLIAKLKEKNADASLPAIVATKLVEKFIGAERAATSPPCESVN